MAGGAGVTEVILAGERDAIAAGARTCVRLSALTEAGRCAVLAPLKQAGRSAEGLRADTPLQLLAGVLPAVHDTAEPSKLHEKAWEAPGSSLLGDQAVPRILRSAN